MDSQKWNLKSTVLLVKQNYDKSFDLQVRKLMQIMENQNSFLGAKCKKECDQGTEITKDHDPGLIWIIEDDYKKSKFFTIRLESNPMLALTATQAESLELQNFNENNENQKWKLKDNKELVSNDDSISFPFKGSKIKEEKENLIENIIASKFFKRQGKSVDTESDTGSKWTKNDDDGFFTLTRDKNSNFALTLSSEDSITSFKDSLIMKIIPQTPKDNQKWTLTDDNTLRGVISRTG